MSLESLDRAMKGSIDLSVGDIIAKYGDKQSILMAVQKGEIADQAKAVMAGMAIDRIAASALKPPTNTVAQETFAPPQMDMGLAAAQQMQGQPQMPGQGLDQIPVSDQMFEPQGMAGGGIVAFQGGGFSPRQRGGIGQLFAPAAGTVPREEIIRSLTLSELQEFNRSGKLPERLRDVVGDQVVGPPVMAQPSFTQALAGPPIDDSAEIARFAPQAQGTGVPMDPPPPKPEPKPEPIAAPPIASSAVPGLRDQLMGRMKEAFPGQTGVARPEEPTVQSVLQERAAAETATGVDKDFFKNEAKNIVKQRDELKEDKKEAANMRLIEAGLRIMGGESPYAFVNIGKGASEALKGFASDIKDIQKNKREYDKSERELRTAEQLYARNKSEETLKEVQRRREKADDKNVSFQTAMMNMDLQLAKLGVQEAQVRVQERAAVKPSQFQEMYEAERVDPERFKRFRESFASKDDALQRQKLADEALAKSIDYVRLSGSKKPEDIRRANEMKQGVYARYGVGAGAGGADPLGLFTR